MRNPVCQAHQQRLKGQGAATRESRRCAARMVITQPRWRRRWQSTTNVATWGKGSKGESRLAAFVEREVGDAVIPLHDRLIPGTRGNIDHIFVASTGVWVVDAKALKGKVVRAESGPLWRRENQVYVGGRNRTKV